MPLDFANLQRPLQGVLKVAPVAWLALLAAIFIAPACGGSTCPTPEEQTYLTSVPIYQDEVKIGAESVGELFAQAAANPSLLATEDWKMDVAVALSRMETGARAIADRVAPASLSHIDGLHKSSASKVLEAVDLLNGAVNEIDRAAIEEASTLLTSAAEDRAKAASAAEAFCEE